MNTTTEIIHKEHFKHWLFSQPDSREFHFLDVRGCMGCAFVHETLPYPEARFGGYVWRTKFLGREIPIPPFFRKLTLEVVENCGPLFTISDTKRAWLKLFSETVVDIQPAQAVKEVK